MSALLGVLCTTIIPTVGRPSLSRAVESALEQRLGPARHEILVFNNGGGLLTPAVWQKAPEVTVINSHSNMMEASNQGAKMARGRYINFLHDDDYLHREGLGTLIDAAESSGSNWVYGAHDRVDDAGRLMSVNRPTENGNVFALVACGECFHICASVIRKRAFLDAGGFDPAIRILADVYLECRIGLESDFVGVDRVVAGVRVGVASSTADWSLTAKEHRIVREKVLDLPNALPRLEDSVKGDAVLRGRACRGYVLSAVLNARKGHLARARSRLFSSVILSKGYAVVPQFWYGMLYRSHWHAVERKKEEAHFSSSAYNRL